ncbi:diguanylate cyclase domain-containing protein [Pseudomonas sp. N040]|uniref:diguanylate cyclase domain-containing protein n=1 Tax=Pseudomonas sp. N040 TaxID=2785325 RepID=UPI0035BE5AC0
MRRPLSHLLLTACLLAGFAPAQAELLTLGAASSGQQINDSVALFEDTGGQLTIEDILQPDVQQRFQPANGRASVGQSRNPWWIRLQLQAGSQAPQDWWLEAGGANLLDLRLYLADGNGGWRERRSAEAAPFAEGRDYPYRRSVFHLPPLQEATTLYLRSYDPAGNAFPLHLWQLADLQQQQVEENLVFGLIFGVILALLLYNLFIFVSLRDSTYFLYVLTTACALLFILSATGYGFQYLWPQQAVPAWLDRITIPSLWSLFVSLFTMALLQTRRYVPRLHYVLVAGAALYALAVGCGLLGYRETGAMLLNILTFSSIPAAFIAALIRSRQGFFPARLYLLGYGLVLASIVLLTLRAMGLVQPTQLNSMLFPLAVAAETILFSFALAYRIQLLKQQRADALEKADQEKSARLAQIELNASNLQSAVDQRTAELAATNLRLCERERELQHAAFHDPLTNLPNRRYLIERAEATLAEAQRRHETLALLLIDLDHFKPVNDQHGHQAGDHLLCEIGRRLQQHIRRNDMPARLGGDEFAILIGGPDAQQQANEVAARLLQALAEPVPYHGIALQVSISIGGALYPAHGQHFSDLYKSADHALYQVKNQGRSGFSLSPCPAPP